MSLSKGSVFSRFFFFSVSFMLHDLQLIVGCYCLISIINLLHYHLDNLLIDAKEPL